MPITLGLNLSSLTAQRRLSTSLAASSTVFERLSTGARINRASDDAAGLAVSSSLDNKARVFSRASLNVSDAVSLLSIADSTLSEVSGILTRMSELAAQAANGSLGRSQRQTLDKEFAALDAELTRITGSTKFNRLKLFEGEKTFGTDPVLTNTGVPVIGTSTSTTGKFSFASSLAVGTLVNNETGEVKSFNFQGPVTNITVLDNGEVFFRDANGGFGGTGQYYRYSFETEELTQLTNEADSFFLLTATVSADGSTIAFVSETNYVDGATADVADDSSGTLHLFVMDIATGIIRTNGLALPAGVQDLSISADGSQVAVVTSQIGATNYGNSEIATVTYGEGGVSDFTRRTTSGSNALLDIVGINNDGALTVRSGRDFTGQNPSGFFQFFQIGSNNNINQLTEFTGNYTFQGTVADTRGSAISFVTNVNLTGENTSLRRQLYRLDLTTGLLEQITNYSSAEGIAGSSFLSISADGRVLSTRGSPTSNLSTQTLVPDERSYNFEVGQGSLGGISAQLNSIRSTLSGLGALVISSEDSARSTLEILNQNLSSLGVIRGSLGASLSRLTTAQSLLNSQREEFLAASSRITDADIAQESAELVRRQIQQNTATAVLSQANQQPALVLSLLGVDGLGN